LINGSLGKAERQTTVAELKRGDRPISAICTTTLEMGIDIGAIRGCGADWSAGYGVQHLPTHWARRTMG